MLSTALARLRHLPFTALALGTVLTTTPLAGMAAPQTAGTWQTTLQARDLDGNLATAEAYYDTTLNVTWLADANYAQTSGRDADGLMTWSSARAWLAGLTLGGVTGWRLPNVVAAEGISPYGGTPGEGYDISAPSNELAHLVHVTLGNSSTCEAGKVNCGRLGERSFQSGPFVNVKPGLYWSNTVYPSDYPYGNFVYSYDMPTTYQGTQIEFQSLNVWALHSGDVGVSVVPEPGTLSLYLLGGVLMVAAVRRQRG